MREPCPPCPRPDCSDCPARSSSFRDLLNWAAAVLPEGWNIVIDVERDAGSCKLMGPDGEDVWVCADDLSIDEHFRQCVEVATRKARKS